MVENGWRSVGLLTHKEVMQVVVVVVVVVGILVQCQQ